MNKTDRRDNILIVYEILKKYSDNEHALSMKDIQNLIRQDYDKSLDRRIVTDQINALNDFGIQVVMYKDTVKDKSMKKKGYYLLERDFELNELEMLCNCVHSAHYIPTNISKQLIEKLCANQSKYQKNFFSQKIFIENDKKSDNKEIVNHIYVINKAINEHKKIVFYYVHFANQGGKPVAVRSKRDGQEIHFLLSPFQIVQWNDDLYLIGKQDTKIIFFRLDRMQDVRIQEDENAELPPDHFEPYKYIQNRTSMFSDEEIPVQLRFRQDKLDILVDEFGRERLHLHNDPSDERYCIVNLDCSRNNIQLFAYRYLDLCEILSPQDLRLAIKDQLLTTLQRYQ